MNENVIDTLKIEVVGDSSKAVGSLDKLINTLDRIKSVTSGGNKGLTGIDRHLAKISAACDKINAGALSKIYKLADGLRTLNDVGNVKISSKFADRILDLGAAIECLKGLDMSKLTEMAQGLQALNGVGKVNIPDTPVKTPASSSSQAGNDFSGTVQVESQVVKDCTKSVGGLNNILANTLGLFSRLKQNITGVASSVKQTISDSAAWQLMSRSVRDVSSAVSTLVIGMGRLGSVGLSFAKHIAKGLTAPAQMAIGAVQGLTAKLGNLFRLFKKRTLYRAMNFVISSITKGFSEGTKHVYEYSKAVGTAFAPSLDKIATSSLYLKNSLGAMVAPLINMLAPAIDTIVDKFVNLLNIVNQVFATMSGATTWTKAIKYPVEYGDATKKATAANDKLKKSILGFDEINPLHDNSKSSSGSGKQQEDYSLMFEEKPVGDISNTFKDMLGDIFKPFAEAWANEGMATINSFKNYFNAMLGYISAIGESFRKVWTNGTGQKTLETILRIFQNINACSANLYTNLTKAWKANDNGTKIIQNIWDTFNAFLGGVEQFYGVTADWIATLDFTPIMTSIANLTSKLEPLTSLIMGALLEAYQTVLLPIASWIIEDAAPASIDALSSAFDALQAILKPVKDGLKYVWEAIKPLVEWIEDTAIGIIGGLKEIFDSCAKVFKEKGQTIQDIVKGIGDVINVMWNIAQPIFLMLKDLIDAVFSFISAFVEEHLGDVLDALKGLIDFIVGVFTLDFKKAWNGIKDFIVGCWNVIKDAASVVWDAIVQIFKYAWEGIKAVFSAVGDFFVSVWDCIKAPFIYAANWFGGIFADVWRFIKKCWDGVKSFFEIVWGWIKFPFVTAADWFKGIFEKVASVIRGIWNGIKDFIVGIWNTIKSIIDAIKAAFKGIVSANEKEFRAKIEEQVGRKLTDEEWNNAKSTGHYANGGLVDEGQMFIAREAGPELVGTIGRRTAVVNNEQIIDSVAQGVADANAEQNALLREEISILRRILDKDYGAGGGSSIDIISELTHMNRRDGKTMIPIGV